MVMKKYKTGLALISKQVLHLFFVAAHLGENKI
jgi:hypothetical protein